MSSIFCRWGSYLDSYRDQKYLVISDLGIRFIISFLTFQFTIHYEKNQHEESRARNPLLPDMLPSLMRRYEVIVIPPIMERAKKIREIKASGKNFFNWLFNKYLLLLYSIPCKTCFFHYKNLSINVFTIRCIRYREVS